MTRSKVRGFVEILIIPIGLIAAYVLFVSVTFGNPDAVSTGKGLAWLLIVSSPAWFYGLLVWSKGSQPRTAALFALSLGMIVLVSSYVFNAVSSS